MTKENVVYSTDSEEHMVNIGEFEPSGYDVFGNYLEEDEDWYINDGLLWDKE